MGRRRIEPSAHALLAGQMTQHCCTHQTLQAHSTLDEIWDRIAQSSEVDSHVIDRRGMLRSGI